MRPNTEVLAAPRQTEEIVRAIACIVLPTYNEAENVSGLLPRILSRSAAIDTHELHVVVVDDASPDGTADRVRESKKQFPNLHLITSTRRGLGDAYIRGITHAIRNFQLYALAWIFLISGTVSIAGAQGIQISGRISGRVEDASGAAVSGATVTVKSLETGHSRVVTTDAAGNFTVVGLASRPAGGEGGKEGFQSDRSHGNQFGGGAGSDGEPSA